MSTKTSSFLMARTGMFSILVTIVVLAATGCQRQQAAKANAAFSEGMSHFNAREYEQAVEKFTEAIRLKPDDAFAYHNRGLAYQELKKFDQAIDDHTEAIRLRPDFSEAYAERANAYAAKGQLDKSNSDQKKAAEFRPAPNAPAAATQGDIVIGGEDDFVNVPAGEKQALIEINKAVPHVNYSYHKGGAARSVRNILLEKGKIDDALLAHVASLPRLTSLTINSADVTNDGLSPITGLRELERLVLVLPKMNDSALETIQKLPALKSLLLRSKGITNAGIPKLKSFENLQSLSLSATGINDAGLAQLAELPQVKELTLSQIPVTDTGLANIANMKNLEKLYIGETKVTDVGLDRLRRSHPKLQIIRIDLEPSRFNRAPTSR